MFVVSQKLEINVIKRQNTELIELYEIMNNHKDMHDNRY